MRRSPSTTGHVRLRRDLAYPADESGARSCRRRSRRRRLRRAPADVIEVILTGSVSRAWPTRSPTSRCSSSRASLSLEEAFESRAARRTGVARQLGRSVDATRRVFGYLGGHPVDTIWWSRELAEELVSQRSRRSHRERLRASDERLPRAGRSGSPPIQPLVAEPSRRPPSACGWLLTRRTADDSSGPTANGALSVWSTSAQRGARYRLRAQPRPHRLQSGWQKRVELLAIKPRSPGEADRGGRLRSATRRSWR